MRSLRAGLIVLLAAAAPAAGQGTESRARTIADNAGTIVGQARSCGVSDVRVERIGARVLSAITRTAEGSGADARSALELYASAAIDGSRRQAENATGQSCSEALASFERVEEMLSRER